MDIRETVWLIILVAAVAYGVWYLLKNVKRQKKD